MAKRKRPTARSIRQGQTIYHIYYPFEGPASVVSHFITSQKAPQPKKGEVAGNVPVDWVRDKLLRFGNRGLYYSRKRAMLEAKKPW